MCLIFNVSFVRKTYDSNRLCLVIFSIHPSDFCFRRSCAKKTLTAITLFITLEVNYCSGEIDGMFIHNFLNFLYDQHYVNGLIKVESE